MDSVDRFNERLANYKQISNIPANVFSLRKNKNCVTSPIVIHLFTVKTPLAPSLFLSIQF